MLDEKTRAMFRAWGQQGGKTKASRYTKKELSLMSKRAFKNRGRKARKAR